MNHERLSRCASRIALGLAFLAGLAVGEAEAQAAPSAAVDSLRREVAALRARLDSLHRAVAEGRGGVAPDSSGNPLAALRAAARAAVEDTAQPSPQPEQAQPQAPAEGPPGQFMGRERSLQALNPEISVNTDVFVFVPTQDPEVDNFVPREFEISFQAPLDPFSRAKIFLSRRVAGGGLVPFEDVGHEEKDEVVEIEEGYAQWVNVPARLGLSVGLIRQRLGTLNPWHRHALPGQTLPLPFLAWLGEEGLAQTGISLYWLAPVHGFGTYEFRLEVMRSSNELFFGESRKPNVLAHFAAFWELPPAAYFEIGLSGLAGTHEAGGASGSARLFSVETAFNWRPPERALYRDLTLRGAILVHSREPLEAGAPARNALGAYALGEYRFSRRWVAGLRYDFVENPQAENERAWLVAPTPTWWQSEWVRIRAEYDFLKRPEDTFGHFLLQVTFAMGPHKHETY